MFISVGASLAGTVFTNGCLYRGMFLSMGAGGSFSFIRLAADFLYLFDVGLLVSMVAPFIDARLPSWLLGGLAIGVLVGWVMFMTAAVRRSSPRERILLVAITAVLAGACLMVNLGRPSDDTVVVRWAAKHVGHA